MHCLGLTDVFSANQHAIIFEFLNCLPNCFLTTENNPPTIELKVLLEISFHWSFFSSNSLFKSRPFTSTCNVHIFLKHLSTMKKDLTSALNRWHICTQSCMIGCWYNRWNGTASVSSAPSSKNTPAKCSCGEKTTYSRVDSDITKEFPFWYTRHRQLPFTRINGPPNKTSLFKGIFSLSPHP